eukprot:1623548-Amphidinium_carterae.2
MAFQHNAVPCHISCKEPTMSDPTTVLVSLLGFPMEIKIRNFARLCEATLVDSDEEAMGEPSLKDILEAIRSVDKKLENKVDALATTVREVRAGQDELRVDVSRLEDRVTSLERNPRPPSSVASSSGEELVGVFGLWPENTKRTVILEDVKKNHPEILTHTTDYFVPGPRAKVMLMKFASRSAFEQAKKLTRELTRDDRWLTESRPLEERLKRGQAQKMYAAIKDMLTAEEKTTEDDLAVNRSSGTIYWKDKILAERRNGSYKIDKDAIRASFGEERGLEIVRKWEEMLQ